MHPNLFPTYSFFLLILVLVHAPRVLSKNDEHYVDCGIQVRCANMEISYPFWGGKRPSYCGHPGYELKCNGDAPELTMMDVSYRVLDINTLSQNVTVARADYWNDYCPDKYVNTTLDAALFNYTSTFPNLTLYYDCPSGVRRYPNSFTCSDTNTNISVFYTATGSDTITVTCMDNVTIPIFQSAADDIENGLAGSTNQAIAMSLLGEALAGGFGLELIAINNSLCEGCVGSGGQCGYNATYNEFACFCPDMPYPSTCPNNTSTGLCEACVASGGRCDYNWTSNEFTCNCSGIPYAVTCPNNTNTSLCKECVASGGQCGYNGTSNEFACNCSDIPYAFTCPNNTNTSLCEACVASGGRCVYNQTVFSCLCRGMLHPSTCPKDAAKGMYSYQLPTIYYSY